MTPEPTPSQELEKLYQSDHSIGSHSDDRGGSADFPCYCQVKKRIEAYIKQHELSRKQEWAKKKKQFTELINLYGVPRCAELHHPKKYQHTLHVDCPVETRIEELIKEQSKE